MKEMMGVIDINDTLEHIDAMIQTITNTLSTVTVMLQPLHPIYNATYYPE
jgi:pyruvate-formate lyase-activating enzyme